MFATLDLPLRDDNRHKRLKVGRACHICRMKKIKCDGKQPCMQCKARRRKCMYLKNTEATYIKLDPDEPLAVELINSNNNNNIGNNYNNHDGDVAETMEAVTMDNDFLFQTDSQHSARYQNSSNSSAATLTRTDKMMEQLTEGLVQLTIHPDSSTLKQAVVTPWRNYGDFIRWSSEPALPTEYSASLDMPQRSMQEHLIQVFFTHCQPYMLPTLSKGMLYDQIHTKGPLITPLLLNMIYAHASAYQHQQQQPPPPLGIPPSTLFPSSYMSSSRPSSPFHSFSSSTSSSTASSASTPASSSSEADVFYQRARQLLDDFMDTPRISTVIALIYMVSFENNIQHQQQRTGRSSRAWMYSGMAIRMCLELGLHTSHYSSQMSQFDIELRKRVLWTCYVMDKVESCTMERPCMLRAQDITLDLPTPLPEDDQQERNVLDGFAPLCRLMMLVEKVLVFFTYGTTKVENDGNTDGDWTTIKEAQVLYFLDKLAQWRERLPEELQWRPHPSSSLDLFGAGGMAAMRPSSAIAANLHLLSYDLELSLVLCCRFQMGPMQCDRRRAVANTITHLVTLMVQHPHLMYTPSFALSGFSGIFAALVHAMDVDHPTRSDVAKDAKLQFKLTLEMIRGLVERIPMRDVQHFVSLIDGFLQPTSATAPPFLFVSAMNNLAHLGQTSTAPGASNSSSSNGNSGSNNSNNSNNNSNSNKDSISSSITNHDNIMQRMLGTNDLYEAQMIAKTLSTMQQHHNHHSSFPTPFTTPSPPPIHPRHHQQDGSMGRLKDHPQKQQPQHSYPSTAASSSVTSPSSSPPPTSVSTASVMPGMPCFDFASSQAAAAAAAAVGAVGTPLTNPQQLPTLPMTAPTSTSTATATSSMIIPAMTIPTGGPHAKNIEPADYTFELISVDDEWAKSLIY